MAAITLGISPGTRSLGIGIIQDGDLADWNVKNFKGRWSREKMELILKLVDTLFDPSTVTGIALKEVSVLHSSENLQRLIRGIIDIAMRKEIKISRYTISDLKRKVGHHGKHTKDELMEWVTEKYPILKKEYLKERNNLNPYYLPMFEAIAAARILLKELEQV